MKTLFFLALALPLTGCQQASAPEAQAPTATPAAKPAAVDMSASDAPTSVVSKKPIHQESESVKSQQHSQQASAASTQKLEGGSPKLRASYDQCISAAGGVTPSMHDCISTEYRFQDARLNNAYKMAMAKLGAKEKVLLRDAQREWINTRDEQCASDTESGQAGALDAYECRLEMTANRATELESR